MSLGLPAPVSPAAVAFPATVVISVALAMLFGPSPVTQPAGFAGGRGGNTAVMIPRQQFTQAARWCVQYLDTGFRQALRGPPADLHALTRLELVQRQPMHRCLV